MIGSVHIARDITGQRHADEEIRKASLLALQNPSPVLRVSRRRADSVCQRRQRGAAALVPHGRGIGSARPDAPGGGAGPGQRRDRGNRDDLQVGRVLFLVAPIAGEAYANLYGRDITERKRPENVLRQSEEQFRRAVENAGAGVIIAELDGTIRYANQAFLKLVGFAEENAAAGTLRWETLTPPEHAPAEMRKRSMNSSVQA